MSERDIFDAALAIDDPAQRAAYLDRACAGNSGLREHIDGLLSADGQVGSFLEAPALGAVATRDEPVGERPGTVIGPYKLLEQIGEGGFGVVFMAEQQAPLRRKVALKVLKPGMDTRQVVARFEAERQALALMDHPNIAHVFDGGATASGRPYFVMELVRGVPITDFCDQNRLGVRERLGLFVDVCQAVQHAHQKGIIHRDLKPSNVLVTLHDDRAVVKAIDFGIAKAAGQQLTDKTLFTNFAQMIGTPLYMSPEQALLSGLDIDTRTDIYALGVLLYELLTGTTPFDGERLRAAGYDEMRRIIREEEAPQPSARLSTLGEAAATVSANRQSDPRRLSRLMRGELDWIVMKALEKDRNRRYESASAFAADVRRYRDDEPVHACPPSAWYRCRKLVRRHKAALLTAALVAFAVLTAVGGVGWIVRDRAARQAKAAGEVEQFLGRADVLYRDGRLPEALGEAQKAQGLVEAGGLGEESKGRVESWLADLDMAGRLEELALSWFEDADVSRTAAEYARVFRNYNMDVEALPPTKAAERVAASRVHADLVSALDDWAWQLTRERGPAEVALRRRLRAIVQDADPDPWRRRCRQASDDKAVAELREMAASADVTGAHVRSLTLLGAALETAGDPQAAAAFLRRVQQQHPGDFGANYTLVYCLNLLPLSHTNRSIADEALGFARVLAAFRPGSPSARFQLARALSRTGRHVDEAVAEFREAIRLKPDYAHAHMLLGALLLNAKRDQDGGFAELSRAIECEPADAQAWCARGSRYLGLGQTDKALADFNRAIEVQPRDREGWGGRAAVLMRLGQHDKALADLTRAIDLDPTYSGAWAGRGATYARLGRKDEALADFARAIDLKPDYLMAYRQRGELYLGLRQFDKAVADFSRLVELRPEDIEAHNRLGGLYLTLGQPEKALGDFCKVTELDPKSAYAWHVRGQLSRDLGQLDNAVAAFSRAIELNRNSEDDWISRGRIYRQLGQTGKALDDFSQAVRLFPASGWVWRERGQLYVETGRWEEAAADLAKVVALEPAQPTFWRGRALALLAAGDKDGYRKTCAEMCQHFAKTKVPAVAWAVVFACVAAPEGMTDPAQVIALAQVAASRNGGWNADVLGAALYRAGQPGHALPCLQVKVTAHTPRAWDLLFQAMAQRRLGHAEDALRCLSQAEQWVAVASPPGPQVEGRRGPTWSDWQEEVAVRALHREAEDFIKRMEKAEP
jgi:tetratricopeptide (TPR) repeat protein